MAIRSPTSTAKAWRQRRDLPAFRHMGLFQERNANGMRLPFPMRELYLAAAFFLSALALPAALHAPYLKLLTQGSPLLLAHDIKDHGHVRHPGYRCNGFGHSTGDLITHRASAYGQPDFDGDSAVVRNLHRLDHLQFRQRSTDLGILHSGQRGIDRFARNSGHGTDATSCALSASSRPMYWVEAHPLRRLNPGSLLALGTGPQARIG